VRNDEWGAAIVRVCAAFVGIGNRGGFIVGFGRAIVHTASLVVAVCHLIEGPAKSRAK